MEQESKTYKLAIVAAPLHEKLHLLKLDRASHRADFIFENSPELRNAMDRYCRGDFEYLDNPFSFRSETQNISVTINNTNNFSLISDFRFTSKVFFGYFFPIPIFGSMVYLSLMNLSAPHVELLSRYIFLIPVVVGILCEITKLVIESLKRGEIAFDHFFHSGGFPSGHSSFVTSLLIVVWYKMGLESVEFAIAATFAAIIWYDAMGSRREIGLQAEVLNHLQRLKHFRTRVGHSFIEVMGGIVFGALVTWLGILLSL